MPNPYLTAFNDPYYLGRNAENVDRSFDPFRKYLEKAQRALEKKQVTCEWEKVSDSRFLLEFDRSIYEVQPTTEIEFNLKDPGWFEITGDLDENGERLDSEFEPVFSSSVVIGKGKSYREIEIPPNNFKTEGDRFLIFLGVEVDYSIEKINWAGYSLAIKSLTLNLPETFKVTQSGYEYRVTRIEGSKYSVVGLLNEPSVSFKLGEVQHTLDFKLLNVLTDTNNLVEHNSKLYRISNKKPKIQNASVSKVNMEMLSHLSIADLRISINEYLPESWDLENQDGEVYLDTKGEGFPDTIKHAVFDINLREKVDTKKEKWIQLLSLAEENDTESSHDPLEYFFDDNIDVLDFGERAGRNAGYRIIKTNRDERQVILCRKEDKSKKPVYPTKRKLEVKVNTQGLWQQREAITKLKLAPSFDQKPLLELVNSSNDQVWPLFEPRAESEINWKILSDIEFDGCDKQREFVCKALNTPDYAILDGPPGTGKTTTILELIIQLVREGKRILLTASTHAAINNVLERVISNELENEIFPLRVGDEGNAIGVEEFQFDNLKAGSEKSLGLSECSQLMVDSSNLVCGTTMGINRLFNNKDIKFDSGYASFDYMIIDECSKTTFSEFLVPARFAKRWVLVGDVKQLSPFTDREQVVSNLKELSYHCKDKKEQCVLNHNVQRACYLLNKLKTNQDGQWGFYDKLIVPVNSLELLALKQEMEATPRPKNSAFRDVCLVGESMPSESIQIFSSKEVKESPWSLYDYNLIFIDTHLVDQYLDYLPADAILLDQGWLNTSHYYRHHARYDGVHKSGIQHRKTLSAASDINQFWINEDSESSWADQLVWRLEREYWLRYVKGAKKGRSKYESMQFQIQNYFPKSIDVKHDIYRVRDMAFPSILEALSGSGIIGEGKGANHTLNKGFSNKEKRCRHSTLTYQHRMHPDISKYPREAFYSDNADTQSLLDGKQTKVDREWTYQRYPKHSVWLDIDNGKDSQTGNEREASAVLRELEAFVAWANSQEKTYDVAILTFYRKQETLLREKLKVLTSQKNGFSRFKVGKVEIKLNTVDYFQGQEADLVLLSMVNTSRDGFLDSPNRLNVAITRARYQLVICGKYSYFNEKSGSNELYELSESTQRVEN